MARIATLRARSIWKEIKVCHKCALPSGMTTGLTSEKPRKPLKSGAVRGLSRASYQNRTDDLFITSETLYRLS
jgi:hypothetical protein